MLSRWIVDVPEASVCLELQSFSRACMCEWGFTVLQKCCCLYISETPTGDFSGQWDRMLKKAYLCWQWATVNILDWKLWSHKWAFSRMFAAAYCLQLQGAIIMLAETNTLFSLWFIFTKLRWKRYKLSNL